MKKKIYIGILLTIILTSVACQDKVDQHIELDIENIAAKILSEVDFEDEIRGVSEDLIENIYDLEDVEEKIVYLGAGATSEELTIFKYGDEDSLKSGLKEFKERVEDQIETFESYAPEEVKKLENSTIKSNGKYLLLCVSNDENMDSIIDRYFK